MVHLFRAVFDQQIPLPLPTTPFLDSFCVGDNPGAIASPPLPRRETISLKSKAHSSGSGLLVSEAGTRRRRGWNGSTIAIYCSSAGRRWRLSKWGFFLKREGCDALATIFIRGFLHKKTAGRSNCRPFMPFSYRRNLPVSATV